MDDQTMTIAKFCQTFGISRTLFYTLQQQGKAPRIMKLGARVLISIDAVREWRQAREHESSSKPNPNPQQPSPGDA